MHTTLFGNQQPMKITEPVDTWLSAGLRDFAVPEAVGSSARVFSLDYAPMSGDYANSPVIKIMRPDQKTYAKPLFESEIRILSLLKDVKGVTPMLALAFLQVESGAWPAEIAPLTTSLQTAASAASLKGSADIFDPDESESFLEQLPGRMADGWLPAIILPRRWEDNLYLRCDAGYTRGEFHRAFSVKEALQISLQICSILEAAHAQRVVYLDHKILHYYWNEPRRQTFILDWNIGRIVNHGNQKDIFAFDVLQFSARALHHLLTGRQAPGSVNVGPNRPEDIQNAPEAYPTNWTYDDQKRLTPDELGMLGQAIQGHYQTPAELAQDLQALYNHHDSKN